MRRGMTGKLGLSMRLELQVVKRDISFRGGELDSFIENYHRLMNMPDKSRKDFPRDQFGIYVWDNEKTEFVYRLDDIASGYNPESRTVSLKLGLIQGASIALALRYAANYNNSHLHQINQVEGRRHQPQDYEDRLLAADFLWAFKSWGAHLGYGETRVAKRFLPQSPDRLLFQFYAFIGRIGDESEWMFQDLTYTSLFPKDGRETLYQELRERTLGMRVGFGEHFLWQFGIVNNVSWQPQNIDGGIFSGLTLQF